MYFSTCMHTLYIYLSCLCVCARACFVCRESVLSVHVPRSVLFARAPVLRLCFFVSVSLCVSWIEIFYLQDGRYGAARLLGRAQRHTHAKARAGGDEASGLTLLCECVAFVCVSICRVSVLTRFGLPDGVNPRARARARVCVFVCLCVCVRVLSVYVSPCDRTPLAPYPFTGRSSRRSSPPG